MKTNRDLAFYRRFLSAKQRCHSKREYKYYGEKGVTMGWNSFLSFKKDMLESFVEHVNRHGIQNTTLDRIDSNGGYSKKNCRWATRKIQSLNTSRNRIFTVRGITDSLSGWGVRLGVNRSTLSRWFSRKRPTAVIISLLKK